MSGAGTRSNQCNTLTSVTIDNAPDPDSGQNEQRRPDSGSDPLQLTDVHTAPAGSPRRLSHNILDTCLVMRCQEDRSVWDPTECVIAATP